MAQALARLEKRGGVVRLIVEGKPFVMLTGELRNSSGANLEQLGEIFARLVKLNLNTAIVPVSWELVEAVEGEYDFRLVDGMISLAGRFGLKLVLLWFGAWKNGKSCYCPEWVKGDLVRFPRVEINEEKTDIISPFGKEIAGADARAFGAVMRRVKEMDTEGVVVMAQVENEVGILGAPRDYCAAAEAAYWGKVPGALTDYLKEHVGHLLPEVHQSWARGGEAEGKTWEETFWNEANEFFMAWHMGSHIEKVTAAGKREHDIPMYANAWLVQPGMTQAGQYPSGGPVSRVMDIWRAAAPHIDFIAPDIYSPTFKKECESYSRSGNPLFIPEVYTDIRAASAMFYAFGQHAAMGYGPFAVDDLKVDHPLGKSYAALREVMPVLVQAQQEGRVIGFYQEEEDDKSEVEFAGLKVYLKSIRPATKSAMPGAGLLIQLSDDEFLAVGFNYNIWMGTLDGVRADMEMARVDEGTLRDGVWVHKRRLNGDETLHGQMIPLKGAGVGEPVEITFCKVKLNKGIGKVRFQAEWSFATQENLN